MNEIIHLEMNYEDYDFMDHLYEVMVQNGLWEKKNTLMRIKN